MTSFQVKIFSVIHTKMLMTFQKTLIFSRNFADYFQSFTPKFLFTKFINSCEIRDQTYGIFIQLNLQDFFQLHKNPGIFQRVSRLFDSRDVTGYPEWDISMALSSHSYIALRLEVGLRQPRHIDRDLLRPIETDIA